MAYRIFNFFPALHEFESITLIAIAKSLTMQVKDTV